MQRKILIVDDQNSNRRILRNMLENEYCILEAADGAKALLALRDGEGGISAVLLDISMPVMDGYETLRRIRSDAALSEIPVIMITGSEDEEARTKSLALGADDFVMKPYNPEVIRHCLKKNITVHETASIVDALKRDKLTGLYTREAFFEKAETMIAAHAPGYYIMACFDVDKFKMINDQYGTKKGDEVLRHIARTFEEGFAPEGGICCRVSADNFAVLYPASFRNSGELAAIRERASGVEGLVSPIAFSIGRYLADDLSLPPSGMYDRAILAENTVKGRYDKQIADYDESMRDRLILEQEIVNEMEGALAARQFETWFQPQYNHSTGALIGTEALVRWRHPEKGLIPPGVFIPLFEQNGFVYSLDRFIWEEVCILLRRWIDAGKTPLPVSVNVSRYDMFRPDVVETLVGLVQKYDLPIDFLRIEITESAFAESTQHIVEVVKCLIGYGFTVEIDDFGSGYSSLNTLKDVPAQIIKLDMKFLESTADSSRGGNIVESVVRMAKWLDMSVIAEGVEEKAQADYLRSIGCNYIQGFLYARPMPADSYEALFTGSDCEEKLLALETVENLDNNSFWDPASMDTLIFNSYVGGACIYEYHNGKIELIRATEKYAEVIGSAGMTVEDALKLDWAEHLDGEDAVRVIADLETSIETRREVTGEYVFFDLPGCPHETYLRSHMRVIASAGNRYLVYCTNENITAQRKAEQRERGMAERLQAIMDNVDLGIIAAVVHDGVAEYLFTNDHYYEMLGCTKEQFQKEISSPYMTIAPEDRQRIREETQKINRTGKSTVVTYNVVTRDRRRRVFRAAISMARLSGVEEPVQLSILRDITDEVETERREKKAAEQLQSMMDDMPGGFIRMRVFPDGGLRPVYINAGFEKLVGLSHDEIMSLYAVDAFAGVHQEDVSNVIGAFERMFETGEAYCPRYRLRNGGGGYIYLSVFGRATKDASGETFLNLYYTNVTGQVRQEEKQKELLDNLPGGAALYEYRAGELSVVHLNRSYWALVGRSPKELADVRPTSAVHPDDMPHLMAELESAVSEKRDLVCDVRLKHETEGYRFVHLVGRIIEREDGAYSIYATFQPISDEEQSYRQMLPIVLSTIMESTSDLSFAKDRDLRYICASRAFTDMVGLQSPADAVGKTDFDIFEKSLAEKYRADDAALLQSGQSIIDMVECIPSPDGVPHYSSTSKHLFYDADGNVIGLYGVGRDVTKYMDAFGKLRLLTESIPGGLATYVCTNGDFSAENIKLTYCNDGVCRLFDMTHEEYEKRASINPIGTVFAEDLPLLAENWRALMEHDTPMNCMYRVHIKGGRHRWISHRAVAADRRDGKVVINAILQDVTEQREMIEQLRISQEENALAVQLGGNIVCRYTVSDRMLTMARETAAEFSLPETAVDVPDGPLRLGMIAPESADAYRAFFETIRRGGRAGSMLFQQKYQSEWRWMEAKSSTIFSDDGEPVKAIVSFFDVTDELEKETVFRKWQQQLREKDADSYTLFRCNLNKDASFDTKEGELITYDFAGAGLHFNDRVRAYVQNCVFADDRDKYIFCVNADRMLASYYRGKRSETLEYREVLPDGKDRWLRLSIDLVEMPNSTDVEAYLMYENIDGAKRGELEIKELAETDPLTGILNRTAFAAAVERLLGTSEPGARNAFLMMDIDGFKQVNDVFGHAAGDQALIDYANVLRTMVRRGDVIGRLGGDEFFVFLYNVQNEAAAANKARQILTRTRKSFSLEVRISSSVGISFAPRDGTTFSTLYEKADAALYHVKGAGKDSFAFYRDGMEEGHAEPAAAAPAERVPEETKRRMLIVDDSAVDFAFLSNLFKDEFFIEKAADGNTALMRLRHYGSAVSVVLLDLVMPGMDGFQVLERMRGNEALSQIPVIVVSGDESRETCLKTVRSGATDYITKPVDAELLRIRVRSAVSRAENERLRAKNSYLELQSRERARCEAAISCTGSAVIEFDPESGAFAFDPFVHQRLAGVYDERSFWDILRFDGVADRAAVEQMKKLVDDVAGGENGPRGSLPVTLRTPSGEMHAFRMNVMQTSRDESLAGKIMITLIDLDAGGEA